MSEGPARTPDIEFLRWLENSEPSWTSWTAGLLVGLASIAYGGHGILAKLRGEPPGNLTPSLWAAVAYLAFGVWVLIVFAISGLPQ